MIWKSLDANEVKERPLRVLNGVILKVQRLIVMRSLMKQKTPLVKIQSELMGNHKLGKFPHIA